MKALMLSLMLISSPVLAQTYTEDVPVSAIPPIQRGLQLAKDDGLISWNIDPKSVALSGSYLSLMFSISIVNGEVTIGRYTANGVRADIPNVAIIGNTMHLNLPDKTVYINLVNGKTDIQER